MTTVNDFGLAYMIQSLPFGGLQDLGVRAASTAARACAPAGNENGDRHRPPPGATRDGGCTLTYGPRRSSW